MKKIVFCIFGICSYAQLMAMDVDGELFRAIQKLDTQKVADILNTHPQPDYNACYFNNTTPLMQVSAKDASRPEIIVIAKLLLEKNADPNITNHYHRTALRCAATACNAPLCKLLINAGANLAFQNPISKETLLFNCVDGVLIDPITGMPVEQFADTTKTLITTIPLSENETIQNTRIFLGLLKSKTLVPLDIRKLIGSYIIHAFVQGHLNRIESILLVKNRFDETASQYNAHYGNINISALLNPSTLHTNPELIKAVSNNIKRILLGKSIEERRKNEQTHYQLLGIKPDATPYEIDMAYQTLYLRMHEALNTLRDPAKRTAYDEMLAKK